MQHSAIAFGKHGRGQTPEMFIQDLDQARSGVKVCWSYRVSSCLNSIGLRTDLLVPALIDVDHVVTNLKTAYGR